MWEKVKLKINLKNGGYIQNIEICLLSVEIKKLNIFQVLIESCNQIHLQSALG